MAEERRRSHDATIDSMASKLYDFIDSTEKYREKNDKKLDCMQRKMDAAADTYGPMLDEALKSKKFWTTFWEKRKEEALAMGVKVTVGTMLAIFAYGLLAKFGSFVSSLIKPI